MEAVYFTAMPKFKQSTGWGPGRLSGIGEWKSALWNLLRCSRHKDGIVWDELSVCTKC